MPDIIRPSGQEASSHWGETENIKSATLKKLKWVPHDPEYLKQATFIIARSKQAQSELHFEHIKKYRHYFRSAKWTSARYGDEYARIHDVRENSFKDSKFVRLGLVFCDSEDLQVPQRYDWVYPKRVVDWEAIYRLIFNPERIPDKLYMKLTGLSLDGASDLERLKLKADIWFIELLKIALVHSEIPRIKNEKRFREDDDEVPQYRMLVVPTFANEHIVELARDRVRSKISASYPAIGRDCILVFAEQPDHRKMATRWRYELDVFTSGYYIDRGLSKAQTNIVSKIPELSHISHDLTLILSKTKRLWDFDEIQKAAIREEITDCLKRIEGKTHPDYRRAFEVLTASLTLTDSRWYAIPEAVSSRIRWPMRQLEKRKWVAMHQSSRLHLHEALLDDVLLSWERRFETLYQTIEAGDIEEMRKLLKTFEENKLLSLEPFTSYSRAIATLSGRKDYPNLATSIFWILSVADIHITLEKSFGTIDLKHTSQVATLTDALRAKKKEWDEHMKTHGWEPYFHLDIGMTAILKKSIELLEHIATTNGKNAKKHYKELKKIAGTYEFLKLIKKQKPVEKK